jgi:hypothetical protein
MKNYGFRRCLVPRQLNLQPGLKGLLAEADELFGLILKLKSLHCRINT